MDFDLSIESARQFQTVVFFSQFRDDEGSIKAGQDIFESFSCSIANVADAFDEDGPQLGDSLFFYNYYGKNLLQDDMSLHNELNDEEKVLPPEPQVWNYIQKYTDLEQKSGNTDAKFMCRVKRNFDDPNSKIQLKVGDTLDWYWGYKVYALRCCEDLDRFTYS